MLGRLLAPLACISLIASPAIAQSAQFSAQPAFVDRAGGAEEGNQLFGGPILPPILFAAIVLAGVLTATGVIFDDDDDEPVSP